MRSLLAPALIGALLVAPATPAASSSHTEPLEQLVVRLTSDTPVDSTPPDTSVAPPTTIPARPDELVVAVIDSGVTAATEQLGAALVAGANFVSDLPAEDWSDRNGHGTAVASVVLETAPFARIMPLRVVNDEGLGSVTNFVDAIYWAADNGADVVNISAAAPLTGPSHAAFEAAVSYAVARGVVVVASAGNYGEEGSPAQLPAALSQVLAVGALSATGRLASFSNRGAYLDIVAFGDGVGVVTLTGQRDTESGTSFSAPRVSAVAALLRNAHPEWSVDQLMDHLRASSTDKGTPGPDHAFGWGALDTDRALHSPLQSTNQVMPAQGTTGVTLRSVMGGVSVRGVHKRQQVFVRHEDGTVTTRTGSGFVFAAAGNLSVWTYERTTAGPSMPVEHLATSKPLPRLVVTASRSQSGVVFKLPAKHPKHVPVYVVLDSGRGWREIAYLEKGRLHMAKLKLRKGWTACYETQNDDVCSKVRIK